MIINTFRVQDLFIIKTLIVLYHHMQQDQDELVRNNSKG